MQQSPDATEDGTPSSCLSKAVFSGDHACMITKSHLCNVPTLAHQLCTRCSNKWTRKVELEHRTCVWRHTLKRLYTIQIHALSLGASRTGTALKYFLGGEMATTANSLLPRLFCRQQIGWSPAGSKFIPQRSLHSENSDSLCKAIC